MLFSTMLLRREYTRMGRTSYILIGFWAFMILSPLTVLIFAIISGNHSNEPRYVLKLVSLILNTLLVVFVGLKRIDLENVYSRSTSIYQQLLKTYFIEDESIEEVEHPWDKWDTQEEEVSIIDRENIKSIFIKGTTEIEEPEGIIIYYIIEITYGKTHNLKREVLRRYREFFEMYNDLKSSHISINFPDFPKITSTRKEVTGEVIRQRGQDFNELFQLIMTERLCSPGLSKFLSNKPDIDIAGNGRYERVMSTIQDTNFTVSITKAVKQDYTFLPHANYEIVVRCGTKIIKSSHRFSDFKILHKSLKKKYKITDELPPSDLTKSSINPKVIKERKIKLQGLLMSLIENPITKIDPDVISFLKLDTII